MDLPLSPHLTLLLVQLTIVPIGAQIQAPGCLPAVMGTWNWTINSLNQTPCDVAAYLAAECNNSQFTIPPLDQGAHYTGPSASDPARACECNSVFYSMISACTGCQKRVWIPYDQWLANCSTVAQVQTFPQQITGSTLVPAWAFLNVSYSQPWDNVTACDFGRNPESNGTFRPSFAPQFKTGNAIAVGVIVGAVTSSTILVVGIVGAGGWYIWRRYPSRRYLPRRWQRAKSNSKSLTRPLNPDSGEYHSSSWTPDTDRRFYDPSDPRTYPDSKTMNIAATVTQGLTPTTPEFSQQRSAEYSGLPEP
ncbi:hypothetical protein BJV74DRAFT_883221 [Russula compacta]|nr:hypothetical protein BJV74DRAFT_883221 [Russula compacta]